MIDSHCHLDDPRFAPDFEAMLGRARAVGVRDFVLAGVSPAGWNAQEALCRAHQGLWLTIGLHPWICAHAADDGPDGEEALLDALERRLEKPLDETPRLAPVAVGEIGLHRTGDSGDETLARQERLFRSQLRLAKQHALPVVLHVLRAHERALVILREEGVPARGGVLHSYSGAAALVPAYAALGLSFSFTGPVTYANARRPIEAVRVVPGDRLLVETDAPDQMPQIARVERDAACGPPRNEPANLPLVVDAIARARGEAPAEIARRTTENARRLFGIG